MSVSGTMMKRVTQVRQRIGGGRLPSDFTPDERELVHAVSSYTMTSPARIIGLARAVEYVVGRGLEGEIVECGVWRGGSMLAVAKTLRRCHDESRDLYLFDTFDGMSEPTNNDVAYDGQMATLALQSGDPGDLVHARAGLELVRHVLSPANYPPEHVRFVKGRVEETLPQGAPDKIALLRLDTDWYESTRHELLHLYPRLVSGGVLIIDDYGHWQGARKAVDEYFAANGIHLLLNRLDYTGRIAVKC